MGTPNKEAQEYNRNIIDYKDPGRHIPIMFLLYSRGSLFGVPIKVLLKKVVGVWGVGFKGLEFRVKGVGPRV